MVEGSTSAKGNAAARDLRVGKALRARDDQRKRGKRAAKRLLFGFRGKGFGRAYPAKDALPEVTVCASRRGKTPVVSANRDTGAS